jgi:hypothetical protein
MVSDEFGPDLGRLEPQFSVIAGGRGIMPYLGLSLVPGDFSNRIHWPSQVAVGHYTRDKVLSLTA